MTTTTTKDPCGGFDLDAIVLKAGAHRGEQGEFYGEACLLEWANRATVCIPALREQYGAADIFEDDHPSVSRVIRSFGISWNDALRTDDERTRLLKPYVTRILGTATTDEDEETRAWMATDWLCRVHTPAWLRLAGLEEEARALEATARIVDAVTADAAYPALSSARQRAAAAGAAARDAAWAAAWDAARDAARDAAWAAAWDAAWDAAWAAAGAAAGDAAWAAAWDAARDAAWAAAWDAAWAAAWAAAGAAAGDAAGDAAWAALSPTVETLQASAMELLGAMCDVGRNDPNATNAEGAE